jgi:hypothetical protein
VASFPRRAWPLALAALTGACSLTFDSTQLGVPVALASAARSPDAGTPFRVTKHPVFFFWGMFTIGSPNLEEVLAGQVGTGARVADLRIRVRARWSDLLITGLTAGLFSPRSVTFEGVVVSPVGATTAPPP